MSERLDTEMLTGPLAEGHIFVFGSNLAGRHGAGAARTAKELYGAVYGQGTGRQGQSYAIPTKDRKLQPLPLDSIKIWVRQFLIYAQRHPELRFYVTPIGTGYAGYTDADIAPMFTEHPVNVIFTRENWYNIIQENES